MSTKRVLHWLIFVVALILVVPISMSVAANNAHATGGQPYYIDSHDGSNSNSGTDQNHPWFDFTNVTGHTFNAADTFYLEEGDTWSDTAAPVTQFLHPLGSGSSGSPITITDYQGDQGTALPKINGNGDTATVELYNQHDWVIENLEIQNNPGCTWTLPATQPSSTCSQDRKGVWVHAENAGQLNRITITGLTVDNVYGEVGSGDGPRTDGGIIFQIAYASGDSNTNWDSVSVTGNTIYNVQRNGIFFKSDYQYCVGGNCAINPCDLSNQVAWDPSTNIDVENNTVHDMAGFGIGVGEASGQKIIGNTIYSGALDGTHATGTWTVDSYQAKVESNVVHDMGMHNGVSGVGQDQEPFDSDFCDVGAIIEYNWSYNNQGGFLLLVDDSSNTVVRYNISERDGYGGHDISYNPNYKRNTFMFFIFNSSSTGFEIGNNDAIYNNDFYMDDSPSGTPGTSFVEPTGLTYTSSTQPIFQNNIIENKGTGANTSCAVPNGGSTTVWTINYNGFWGGSSTSKCNTTAPNPQTNGGFYTDPEFASPGNGHNATTLSGVASDYTIQTTSPVSPAVCAGQYVSSQGNDGGRDFIGNSLPTGTKLDVGALEASSSC